MLQVLVCPFETPNLPMSPLVITCEGKVILELHYRVLVLWLYPAQKLLDRGLVELYALLPTMAGATYERLLQAFTAMKAYYRGQESRLINHPLWFDTFSSEKSATSRLTMRSTW